VGIGIHSLIPITEAQISFLQINNESNDTPTNRRNIVLAAPGLK